MSDPLTRDELHLVVSELIIPRLDSIDTRLATINGKVYKHEGDIATLKNQVEEAANTRSKDTASRWGAGVTAALTVLYAALHALGFGGSR